MREEERENVEPISSREVENTVKEMKNNKSAVPEGIPIELVKYDQVFCGNY